MVSLVAGALLLIIALYGVRVWTGADPKVIIRTAARTLGVVALAAAAGALVTGRIGLAMPLGMVGFALLGRYGQSGFGGALGGALGGVFGRHGGGGQAPQTSKVNTPLLELELDHATGDMRGRVLGGVFAGQDLEQISIPDLVDLRASCDAQSLSLLEAYLDRRAPAWREHAQGDAGGGNMGAGGSAPGQGAGAASGGGVMTEEEAYQVLGLEPGADATRVREAHRALMKKVHPDHGGADYLAARINQAKDLILRKHL